jgi:hypothetical protein
LWTNINDNEIAFYTGKPVNIDLIDLDDVEDIKALKIRNPLAYKT